jgi:hypothetical protein
MDKAPQFHVPVTFVADQLEDPCLSVCMIDFHQGKLRLANRKKFGGIESTTFPSKLILADSESDSDYVYVAHMTLKSAIKYNETPSVLDHPKNLLHHIILDRMDTRVNMNILFRGIDTTIVFKEIDDDETQLYRNMAFEAETYHHQMRRVIQTIVYTPYGEPGSVLFLIREEEAVCVLANAAEADGKEDSYSYYRTDKTDQLDNVLREIQDWQFVCIPDKSLFIMVGDSDSYTFHT